MDTTKLIALNIKQQFRAPIKFAFAYGSAVMPQLNNKGSMIDFVFSVNDLRKFHEINMSQFPTHYSFLRLFGLETIIKLNSIRPYLFFNTDIIMEVQGKKHRIKYGVILHEHLINDLNAWDCLYIAGRMQKPIDLLLPIPNDLILAYRSNLKYAVLAAIKLLPSTFTLKELFLTITGLSYLGDIRVHLGAESKSKTSDIVDGNLAGFYLTYKDIFYHELKDIIHIKDSGPLGNYQISVLQHDRLDLPVTLQNTLKPLGSRYSAMDLKREIGRIVLLNSAIQTLKGLLTTGFVKSFYYSISKLRKGIFQSFSK